MHDRRACVVRRRLELSERRRELNRIVERLKEGANRTGASMLHVLALLAVTAVEPTVSTAWLQAHLGDPQVRVICTGTRDDYDRAHIPGARFVDHMDTVGGDHRLLPPDALAKALAKAGAADGTHIVLYGDRPMETGWLYMTLAAIGHADDVSMLDGGIR